MNKRELNLEKYGISSKRYKELCGFCEQYPEWLDELKYKTNTVASCEITDMPIYHSNSDATYKLAEKRAELSKKCELIEKTAREASPDLYEYIIKSVCFGEPFWYLRDIMGMPSGQNAFYDRRRYFFFLLNRNK